MNDSCPGCDLYFGSDHDLCADCIDDVRFLMDRMDWILLTIAAIGAGALLFSSH